MESSSTFLELVKTLVWPVVILVLAFMLRRELGLLLSKVSRIKHKETEIEFQQRVEEAVSAVGDIEQAQNKKSTDELTTLSPRGAIIESWLEVEDSLLSFNARNGLSPSTREEFENQKSRGMLQILDSDVLNRQSIVLLKRLRELYKEALDLTDSEINPPISEKYRNAARQLIRKIDNASL